MEDYILTLEELGDNNFPLPDKCLAPEVALSHTSDAHTQKVEIASTSTTTTTSTSTTSTSSSTSTSDSSSSTSSSSFDTNLQIPKSRSVCIPVHGKWAKAQPSDDPKKPSVIAMDCEMCLTQEGLELTRVSLINEEMETIYDSFVLPFNPILNYNTQYSGITEETLKDVTKRLDDVQGEVLDLISDKTILIGHSLENDLTALKMVHTRVIDTSVLYPSNKGRGFKNALRWLVKKYLGREIQTETHDSIEDSVAVMQLVKHKIQNPTAGEINGLGEGDNLFELLHAQSRRSTMIDQPRIIQSHATTIVDCVPVDVDEKCAHHTIQAVKRTDPMAPKLIVSHLHAINSFCYQSNKEYSANPIDEEKFAAVLKQTDEYIHQIHSALPENTLFIVSTLHGDISRFVSLQKKNNMDPTIVSLEDVGKANEAARQAISFFSIK